MVVAKRYDRGMIGHIERVALGVPGNTRIARRGMKLAQQRALRQFPGKRVFASATPDQQDIHEQSLCKR